MFYCMLFVEYNSLKFTVGPVYNYKCTIVSLIKLGHQVYNIFITYICEFIIIYLKKINIYITRQVLSKL